MRTRWLALLAALATTVLLIVPGTPADAHTPNASDSCEGLKITGRAYGQKGGTAAVTVDGKTKTYRFGDTFSEFIPWSSKEDHSWSVDFTALDGNREGSRDFSGKQAACEKPPAPPKVTTEHDHRSDTAKDCDSRTVTTTREERTREVRTYDDGRVKYGPWSDWKVVDRSTRDATDEECPRPPKTVHDKQTRTLTGEPDCTTGTVTVTEQERTREGTQKPGEEPVWGPWSDWKTTDTRTKPTTEEQCPTPTPTPTQPTEHPPTPDPTPTPTDTPTPSSTPTAPSPTPTPSSTPPTTPTPTVTPEPSSTPSPTPSSTPSPSSTPTPTSTTSQPPSATPSAPSETPRPSTTGTPTPSSPQPTRTPEPSEPTSTPSSTPSSEPPTPGTPPSGPDQPNDRLAQTGAGDWTPWVVLALIVIIGGVALLVGQDMRRGGGAR